MEGNWKAIIINGRKPTEQLKYNHPLKLQFIDILKKTTLLSPGRVVGKDPKI